VSTKRRSRKARKNDRYDPTAIDEEPLPATAKDVRRPAPADASLVREQITINTHAAPPPVSYAAPVATPTTDEARPETTLVDHEQMPPDRGRRRWIWVTVAIAV